MKLLTQLQEMRNFTQTEETIASFILSHKDDPQMRWAIPRSVPRVSKTNCSN